MQYCRSKSTALNVKATKLDANNKTHRPSVHQVLRNPWKEHHPIDLTLVLQLAQKESTIIHLLQRKSLNQHPL